MAGTVRWPDGGQRVGCRRPAGNGRARNRARAPLNWVSQGQRWGRCKVRRRAERVSRPAREKKRRLRVLVVTTCSPRPIRAVQRARLCAITWTASQAPLAAKRQGCGIGVPWASWRIPVWAGSHNDPLCESDGVSIEFTLTVYLHKRCPAQKFAGGLDDCPSRPARIVVATGRTSCR